MSSTPVAVKIYQATFSENPIEAVICLDGEDTSIVQVDVTFTPALTPAEQAQIYFVTYDNTIADTDGVEWEMPDEESGELEGEGASALNIMAPALAEETAPPETSIAHVFIRGVSEGTTSLVIEDTPYIVPINVRVQFVDVDAEDDIQGVREDKNGSLLLLYNYDTSKHPRKRIIIQQVNYPVRPNGYTNNVILTHSGPIKFYASETSTTEIESGMVIPDNQLPKIFWIEATSYSSKMGDAVVKVSATGTTFPVYDICKFTIFSAEKPIVNTTGTVSKYNDKRNTYSNALCDHSLRLGPSIKFDTGAPEDPIWIGWGTEASAIVHPKAFDVSKFPGYNIYLNRRLQVYHCMNNGQVVSADNVLPPDTAPDLSESTYRDDNPAPNGTLYDLDIPASRCQVFEKGTISRQRFNFFAFVTIKQNGLEIKCSPSQTYFIRCSYIQIADPEGADWIVLPPNDPSFVTNDNQAGNGTTPLSWNLQ